jgi:hypothetical protein
MTEAEELDLNHAHLLVRVLTDEVLTLRRLHAEAHPFLEDGFADLQTELRRARDKHPPCTRERFLVALIEETGELAKELLENGSYERIRAEAIQVACVAIRLVTDATDAREA